MSWQAFIDSLTAKGNIDKGAITSLAGDSIWAASPGFEVQLDEMKIVADIFKGNDDAKSTAYADGLHVAKERYVILAIEDRSIYARGCKKDDDPKNEKTGIHMTKTGQAIVIGHHDDTHMRQEMTPEVEALADHLIKMQY